MPLPFLFITGISMTRAEIRTYIREMVAQTDSTNTQYSDSLLNTRINRGYRDFVRRTKCFETSEPITTVANQLEYRQGTAYTTEFFQIHTVRHIIDASNEVGEPLKPYPGGYNNLPRIKAFGKPYHYIVRFPHQVNNTRLIFWPIPATSGETIEISGYNFAPDLTGDNDIPKIKESFHEALVFYTVWKILFPYAHKSAIAMAKMNQAKQDYFDLVSEAMQEFSQSNDDEPNMTIDVYR